jgi:hypothetical protein
MVQEHQRNEDEAEGQTRPEASPSTPKEDVPSEEDVKEDLPGVPEEVEEG